MTTNCYWLGDFTPGDIIQDYMDYYDISKEKLAYELNCPVAAVEMLLAHQSAIDNYYAERLSRVLGHSEEFWLNLEKVWLDNEKIKKAEALASKNKNLDETL